MTHLPWGNLDRTRIRTLRVRGGTAGPGLRLGLSRSLDRADLRPPGFPPAAVLIVRRMHDPLPGRVVPLRPGADLDRAWEGAARDRIAAFYRRAYCPGRESVPADAEAVLFADEGELLASLAADLVAGRLRERWWWASFGRAAPPALASLLCERASWVPAALALLAQQDRAVTIVQALSPPDSLRVLRELGRAHGVAALVASMESPRAAAIALAGGTAPPAGNDADRVTAAAVTETVQAARPVGAMIDIPAPWATATAADAVHKLLDRTQAALLGVALALHQRPGIVRSAAFAAQFARWWNASPGPLRQPVAAVPKSAAETGPVIAAPAALSVHAAITARAAARLAGSGVDEPTPPPTDRPRSTSQQRPEQRWPERPDAGHRLAPAPPAPVASALHPRPVISSPPLRPAAAAEGEADNEPAAAPERRTAAVTADAIAGPATVAVRSAIAAQAPAPVAEISPPATMAALQDGIDTGLGGLFFLINAMVVLNLPDEFEAGWRLASVVGAWGLLEALSRALLVPDGRIEGDPVWAALAALSGRAAGAPLGAGLPRRAAYRLPAGWEMPEDAAASRVWAQRGVRRRIWSQAGYVLSETRRSAAAPPPDVPRASFGDAPLAIASGRLVGGIDHALRRWLGLAIPFLRLRLFRALQLDPAEDALRSSLLARRGRLYVTATHVDVVMRLDSVSLAVRRAGLDRSPGWLGDFGRVVLLHFE